MKLANRLSRVKPSATLAVNAKALELKNKGIDVISLAVGEPDFPTPDHIAEAAKKAIDEHFTKYTAVPGIPEIRSAICEYFMRVYGVEAKPENIIIGNGGKQCLYNLLLCLVDDGDDVLIPVPYWTSYPDMAALVGGNPVFVPSSVENGYKISIEDLEKAYTPKTKVLLLNSPSNPSGVTYSQQETDAILHWAIQKNIFVIADEVYDQLVYNDEYKSTAAKMWLQYPEHIAVINALSKSFAMTGWRLGFTLAHPAIIKEMGKLQGQITSSICSIAQKAGVAALMSSYDCIAPMKEAFRRRRDYAHAEISSWEGVICPKPEGAFYLFPDVSRLFCDKYKNAPELCTYLLDEAKVAVMPGDAFGLQNCIRLSYAVSDETLAKALAAIKKALYC